MCSLHIRCQASKRSAAIDSGNLAAEDEGTYRALFHQRTLTKNMVEEVGLDNWPKISTDFLQQVDYSSYMLMGPHHYVHTYELEKIADEIRLFLQEEETSKK